MLTEKSIPIKDKVLLKKFNIYTERCMGGIFIPEKNESKNLSLGLAQVVKIGDGEQCIDSGLQVNDWVLYDYHSVYDKTNFNVQYIVIDIINVVLIVTEQDLEESKQIYG